MTFNRSCLQFLAMWAVVGGLTLCVGAGTTGCGPSTPPPTPPPAETPEAPPPAPPPMSENTQAQEPTAAEVAAARPKAVVDPFTLPALKGPAGPTMALAKLHESKTKGLEKGKTSSSSSSKGGAAAKPAGTPPPPPTPPNFQAVGIFGGSHGPVAILAPSSKSSSSGPTPGTIIVQTGTKLDDGGYVKAIDPASRKVVIDKQNTDFVLPLEAPAGVSSPSAK